MVMQLISNVLRCWRLHAMVLLMMVVSQAARRAARRAAMRRAWRPRCPGAQRAARPRRRCGTGGRWPRVLYKCVCADGWMREGRMRVRMRGG